MNKRTKHGDQDKLNGRRQAAGDQVQHRFIIDVGTSQIALQQVADVVEVLFDNRPVETKAGNGAFTNVLRRFGRDQYLQRVADGIDAGEHDHRHHRHHDNGLQQSLDDET